MDSTVSVEVTIHFNAPDLETPEREEQAQRLFRELRDMDNLEAVNRVLNPSPAENSKAGAGFLMGMLKVDVLAQNSKPLLLFLHRRLLGKPIELLVKANGKELSVKAGSQEELEFAIRAAQDFINS